MPYSNSVWVQDATMILTSRGYDPNMVVRELSDYVSGKPVRNLTVVEDAIAWMGHPPESCALRNNYEACKQKWVETGDVDWLHAMIESITLDA